MARKWFRPDGLVHEDSTKKHWSPGGIVLQNIQLGDLDTKRKRSSAIHVGCVWRGLFPDADSSIDNPDRQQTAFLYADIAAAAPPAVGRPQHLSLLGVGI